MYAIIPSGGKGKRFGNEIPKQYLKVNGKELIAYTLEVFEKSEFVDEIIVAAQKDFFILLDEIKRNYGITKLAKVIEGGKERQDSVYNALSSLTAENDDLVAVHDAARPLLPLNVLNSAASSAKELGNSVVAMKARDTLVNASTDELNYINRSDIYYIQTPQIFRFGILKKAMDTAYEEKFAGTDESVLVNRLGEKIHFVEGAFENFKITTISDFDLFTKLCR
ncbi:2-C-methyl-D-erythritol 4-phosphate cytidylyltransferase [Bacteroidota bacterium]